MNINFELREKRKSSLIKKMNYQYCIWIDYAKEYIATFADNKAKIIGDNRLLKIVEEAMSKKN
jgi:hypothetical protein